MSRRWGTGTVAKERGGWIARLPRALGRDRVGGTHATEKDAAATIAACLSQLADEGDDPALMGYGDRWLRERAPDFAAGHQDLVTWRRLVGGTPIAALPVSEVEGLDVRTWLASLRRGDGKPYVSTSLAQYLSIMRRVLDQACNEGLLRSNPAVGISTRPMPTRKAGRGKLRLTPEQVDLLIARAPDVLEPGDAAALTLMACTGMRACEARRQRWEHVDLEAGELRVTQSKTDAGTMRLLPLLPPALAALQAQRRREPFHTLLFPSPRRRVQHRNWQAGAKDMREILGEPKFTSGCLRHTVGSILLGDAWVRRGWLTEPLTMDEVRGWLGHESALTTSRHYARQGEESRRRKALGPRTVPNGPADPRNHYAFAGNRKRICSSRSGGIVDESADVGPRADRLAKALEAWAEAVETEDPFILVRGNDLAEAAEGVLDALMARGAEEETG